jgi:hypothetical protein
MSANPPPAPIGTVVPPPAPPAAWHAGLDAELLGHAQTAGWDKLEPAAAAQAAVKAHREAQKMMGVPPDQIIKLPAADAGADAWRPIHQRLGAPEKPEGYDLTPVKLPTPELTAQFHSLVQKTAFEQGISKAAAEALITGVAGFYSKIDTDAAAATSATLAGQTQALEASWGAKGSETYKTNEAAARQAALALGWTTEEGATEFFNTLDKTVGFDKVMQGLLKVNQRMGEDPFKSGGGGGTVRPGPMNYEMAVARREEIYKDTAWVARYNDEKTGGLNSPEGKELSYLNRIIADSKDRGAHLQPR